MSVVPDRARVLTAVHIGRCATCLVGVCLNLAAGTARAQTDFDPTSWAWNGLAELVALARSEQLAVSTPQQLRVGDLRPSDAILIVHPTAPLPVRSLTSFLRAGGRIGLADDFGSGNTLLAALQIGRHPPGSRVQGQLLRGNHNLLIAEPRLPHPLTWQVQALVTNHPQVVHHPELRPLFGFAERHSALVIAGAVGEGRLVVIADSSVLINNMLQFRGNRQFASNLARYLSRDGGRLFVASAGTHLHGDAAGMGAAGALRNLELSLQRIQRFVPDPPLVRLLAALLAGVTLIGCAALLPRSSPYEGAGPPLAAPVGGGFSGRVALFGSVKTSLAAPALALKVELDAELRRLLGTPQVPAPHEVSATLGRLGASPHDVRSVEELLLELESLQRESVAGPRIGATRLQGMVATSRRLLGWLEDQGRAK